MIDTLTTIIPLLEIRDEQFDADKCGEYELLMELGTERMRFCILDQTNTQVLYLEDYAIGGLLNEKSSASWLGQLFKEHPFLGSQLWKKVVVCFNTPSFTLVPDAYFRKEYAASYLGLVRGELADWEQLMHQEVKKIEARNVFAIDKELGEWLLNTYTPQLPIFLHQASALIEGSLRLSASEKKATIATLHFEDDYVTITIAQVQKLLFSNKFAYKSAADMGYFVMFVLDSLQLPPLSIQCYLYGEITPYSEDYQLLVKFIPHLFFGKNPAKLTLGSAFEDLPEHRYFGLYNIFFAS